MSRPNVVLILTDQHRWDFMGYAQDAGYANGVTHTPHLDALAASGTAIGGAHCTAPVCCPSRAAIASGRYGMNSGCFTNLHRLPPGTPSFVQQFREAGYDTCAIGKTHMDIHAYDAEFTSPEHLRYMDSLGWSECIEADDMVAQGVHCNYAAFLRREGVLDDFLRLEERWAYGPGGRKGDPNFKCHEWPLPERYALTSFVGDTTLEWLRRRQDSPQRGTGTPFLLHVGFVAPHSPTAPLPRLMDLYRDQEETPPWNNTQPPEWLPEARRGYRAMITHVDEYVGRIRQQLAELGDGVGENTVIAFSADHGEMAGDQSAFSKVKFYEASVRVPMVFAGPGVRAGQHSDALAETLDLGKTLCDLAGVAPDALDQGKSLAPLLHGDTQTHRETVYAELGCDKMLRDGRYKLAWGEPSFDKRKLGNAYLDRPVNIPASPPALFDLQADPHETRNLADDPTHRDVLLRMLQKLLARINENTQSQPYLPRGEYRGLRPAPAAADTVGAASAASAAAR